MGDRIENSASGKAEAGENQRGQERDGQPEGDRPKRDVEREQDCSPLICRK